MLRTKKRILGVWISVFTICILAILFTLNTSFKSYADLNTADTGLEYYVQCVVNEGNSGNINTAPSIATGVDGLKLPDNQSTTSRVFDEIDGSALRPADTEAAAENKKRWGLYHGNVVNGSGYNSKVATPGTWYETCKPETLYGTAVWSGVDKIIYKFEVDDSITEYDIVIGANNTPLGNHWDAGFNQCASAVFINKETEPSAVTGVTNTNQTVAVNKVKAESLDADTNLNNIITITIDKPTGDNIPEGLTSVSNAVVSFIMITRSSATAPLNLGVKEIINVAPSATVEDLPSTLSILTSQGVKDVDVTYTNTDAFDNKANKFMLNNIEVGAKIFDAYNINIPLYFTPAEKTYYFADMGANWVDGSNMAQVFKHINPELNPASSKIMDQDSASNSWGKTIGGEAGGDQWPKSDSPYFSHRSTAVHEEKQTIEYVFPNLVAGSYAIYLGAGTAFYGDTIITTITNGSEEVGQCNFSIGTSKWGEFVDRKYGKTQFSKLDNSPLKVSMKAKDNIGFYGGFILITDYATESFNDDQAYFLQADNTGNIIPIDGIDLSGNQSVAYRSFNGENGGAPVADITGKHWGMYYTTGMTGNYYEIYGDGAKEPFSKTIAASGNLDTPDSANSRQIVFKFELDKDKTYDVIIGLYCPASWGSDNSDGRAGLIYVNNENKPSAKFGSQTGAKTIHLAGVKSQDLDTETSLNNILTLSVKRAKANSNPMVSFISIRETGKKAVFLSESVSVIGVEPNEDLPVNAPIKVMTTAGEKIATVTSYTNREQFDKDNKKMLLKYVNVKATITYDEKTFKNREVQVSYIIKNDVYYFANLTVIDEMGLLYSSAATERTFKAMKEANPNMLNNERDANAKDGSWGCTSFIRNIESYWGYDDNPYASLKTLSGEGEKHLTYNFTDLPKGKFLVHTGMREPWGRTKL